MSEAMKEAISSRLKSQVQSYSAGRGAIVDLTALKKQGTQHAKMEKNEVDRLKLDIFALQKENNQVKQDLTFKQ